MAKQTETGKAFEYACARAIIEQGDTAVVELMDSPQLATALLCYESLEEKDKQNYNHGARAAINVIKRLEPRLYGSGKLFVQLQADSAGIAGDVRDVLCLKSDQWEIGLSCKHNHHAVKHSRLSRTLDFGKEWFGYPCSSRYFEDIKPLFEELQDIRREARERGSKAYWRDMKNKSQRFYVPLLNAYVKELRRITAEHDDVPEKLVKYLIGRYDFYKVIMDDRRRVTRIEAYNLSGSMNRSEGKKRSIADVPLLKMPTRFYDMYFKEGTDNKIIVACDNGWEISLRIHNAASEVEPSLKFDVEMESLPSSIYSQVEPWD